MLSFLQARPSLMNVPAILEHRGISPSDNKNPDALTLPRTMGWVVELDATWHVQFTAKTPARELRSWDGVTNKSHWFRLFIYIPAYCSFPLQNPIKQINTSSGKYKGYLV